MLRTVLIWLLLIVIVGIPTLITIFATTLVFMEEIEEEEMAALLDKNAEEETCFRQPTTLKTPELQLGNSRSEIQLVD